MFTEEENDMNDPIIVPDDEAAAIKTATHRASVSDALRQGHVVFVTSRTQAWSSVARGERKTLRTRAATRDGVKGTYVWLGDSSK